MVKPADNPRHDLYVRLGRAIRRARTEAGLTQEELASTISLSRTSVTNLEKGRQKIQIHTLCDIAMALGVAPVELLPEIKLESSENLEERIPPDLNEDERKWLASMVPKTKPGGEQS